LALPALCAALCAAAVGAVVATIDSRYQTKASATVGGVLGMDDTLRVMRLDDPKYDLGLDDSAPLMPKADRSLARITERVAAELGGLEVETLEEDVDIVDTYGGSVFPRFKEPRRRLKIVARADDPRIAARIADAFLGEYLAYRRSWYERNFTRVLDGLEERLAELPKRPRLFPGTPVLLRESIAAAELTMDLERGVFGGVTAAPVPNDALTPRPWRDVLVALLAGGLLGWLGPRALSGLRR
jgi:hypothetical protein